MSGRLISFDDRTSTATEARPRADARGTVLAGLLALLLFFGGAGTWAALAPLNGAAVAPAAVKVDGNRKSLEHREGGIVREIVVRNGDRVRQGDVLLRLDDTLARAALDVLEAQHDAMSALQARLVAERDGAEALRPDAELAARSGNPRVAPLLAVQAALFTERRRQLEGATAVLRQQIEQLGRQAIGGEAQLQGVLRQRALIGEELEGVRVLLARSLVPRPRALALERTAAGLDAERGRIEAEIAGARTRIGEAELRILQLHQERMTEVSGGLQQVGDRLAEIAPRLRSARDTLERIELRAPATGEVVGLSVFTEGAVLTAGERVLDIVPSGGTLLFEARLRPEDVNRIALGMAAEIRLAGIADRRDPVLQGSVSTISADRLRDERGGEDHYAVELRVDREAADRAAPRFRLEPGMPATVTIATEPRTALDYLIGPLRDRLAAALREE